MSQKQPQQKDQSSTPQAQSKRGLCVRTNLRAGTEAANCDQVRTSWQNFVNSLNANPEIENLEPV